MFSEQSMSNFVQPRDYSKNKRNSMRIVCATSNPRENMLNKLPEERKRSLVMISSSLSESTEDSCTLQW